MSIIQQNFTTNQTVTITLASLANGSFATSSAIDNSVNKFMSADIQIKLKSGVGVLDTGVVKLLLVRTADGGVTYDDPSDNADLLGIFNVNSNSTNYVFTANTEPVGSLPFAWKVCIENETGAAFDSTGGNFSVVFTGKKLEVV